MNNTKIKLVGKRILFIGLFVISVFLFMDFNARVSELFRKSVQRDKIRGEVYQLQLTSQFLETRLAYATSEVAVEEWARDAHLVQEGDIPVVPLPDYKTTPMSEIQPTSQPTSTNPWEIWKLLIFGY